MTRDKDQAPFDERAALGELERFRADISRYRKQREAVSDDFDEFVRSFPSPVDVFPSERTADPGDRGSAPGGRESANPGPPAPPRHPGAPAPVPPAEPISKPIAAAAKTPEPADVVRPVKTPPAVEPARPAAADTPIFSGEAEAPKRTRTPLLAALIVLLIAGAVAAWMYSRGSDEPAAVPSAVTEATPQPVAPADAAPGAAPPAAPVTAESEITTVRTAWVRLIADGERLLERELPAGTRVPFKAEKTIVIRTGDAGAVRLSIRGEDRGVLGRDGEVITRSFTVPETPTR